MPPINKNYYKKKLIFTPEQKKTITKMLKTHDKRNASKLRAVFTANTVFTCGQAYAFNPLCRIAQGDVSSGRTASKIHLDSMEISGIIEPRNTIANNIRWTFFLWWEDAETFSSSGFTTVTNPNVTNSLPLVGLFSSGQVTNLMFDDVQGQLVSHRKGGTDVKVSTIPSETNFKWKYNFRGKTVTFAEDGTPSFNDGKNLYGAFIADISGGTVDVTPVGNISLTYKLNYHQ